MARIGNGLMIFKHELIILNELPQKNSVSKSDSRFGFRYLELEL
jgi:hypothetical protein